MDRCTNRIFMPVRCKTLQAIILLLGFLAEINCSVSFGLCYLPKQPHNRLRGCGKVLLGWFFRFVLLMALSGNAVIEGSIVYPSYANELTFTNKKHKCQ